MNLSELVWGLLGLLLTVMVLSYLIGDNVFFRLAGHIFIGLTAGYMAALFLNQILLPYLLYPLVRGSMPERLWGLVPLVLVVLLLLSQIPSLLNLGTIPLAYLTGLTAALAVGGAVFGTLIPQSRSVIEAFNVAQWTAASGHAWGSVLEAVVMLIGTMGTLSYFHFGRKRKRSEAGAVERPTVLEALSKVGQVFIGITLGAVFAGVFSSALLALIERIFFIGKFITSLFGGG